MVEKDGSTYVRLDRPDEVLKSYDASRWTVDNDYRPHSRAAIVAIAFLADTQLLRLMGEHDRAKKKWVDLSEQQRRQWIEHGPARPAIRARLYEAIMTALEDYASTS